MDKRTGKGRQKIEIKLSESKEARLVTFSKRKKGFFKKANEFSTRTGAGVDVMLCSFHQVEKHITMPPQVKKK
ncbi:hypothetical protein KY290_032444 [Solanum tuberosum]|uniref:MADS-box domain-containing protein n=1 Tax=Solanum tuberosum TaxID=4113 RepID=A0ABQ7UDQ9_SOLTU|nr:hypothetical protein KY285_031672 [Solanum tuberosum]KAH0700659.1 hypothetical protein KY284_014874 [Solanum tuberosum]KAH0744451.1 hypothetical protein KY290_032444 [Solanum tuberosum]